jgi:hypothetical protein
MDADRELAKAHGAEIDEDDVPAPIAPMDCPRCRKETAREKDFCVWCGQATAHDAVREIKAEAQDLRDSICRLSRQSPNLRRYQAGQGRHDCLRKPVRPPPGAERCREALDDR